jgi:carbamoyltransferase
LAYTAQKVWVDEFLQIISKYKHLSENVSLVGGCALNVSLNSAIAKSGWFKNVYVSPVSGDSGQSLGAILFQFPNIKCDYPYLGCGFGSLKNNANLISQVTKDLLKNKIVAWYQGRSEIGARALGHRSFLGIPNPIEMKIKLSEQVKGREPYRPVAAILTEEFLPRFTSELTPSPYMTFAPTVKNKIKENLPAVVHYDDTSRIQTIKKSDNPILHDILTEIGKITGYPVLMNSSFNVGGEPIVYTPKDALNTFKNSATDVLYINGQRYGKP